MSVLQETPLTEAAPVSMPSPKDAEDSRSLSDHILAVLDEHSAQDTIEIDIRGKSSVADYMIVSSGRSNRHVGALADYTMRSLKERGLKDIGVEGLEGCDWVLIDAGDVIVHLFRPEVRVFYNLEKIWSVPLPEGLQGIAEMSPEEPES